MRALLSKHYGFGILMEYESLNVKSSFCKEMVTVFPTFKKEEIELN